MKTPFYVIQAESRAPGESVTKVGYLYVDSECGIVFADRFNSGGWFYTTEAAMQRWDFIMNEEPTKYTAGSLPGYQYAIPHVLRSAVGGRIDVDGRYEFTFKLIEVIGPSLDKIEVTVVREVEVIAIQFHNEYDKKPIITINNIK
jgi:hypothetical protein